MKKDALEKILSQTEAGYDQMAEKFSGTRSFFWRDLEFIKDQINSGDRVLDFGCGNGRLLEILKNKKIEYYGVDVSQKLVDLAKNKYQELAGNIAKTSGRAKLDFPDDFFDAVISIAVLHHFPDQDFRLAMAQELYRITKPDGKIIITVWNLWQKKYRQYIWRNIFRRLIGKSSLDLLDCEIPFKNNTGEIFTRFHHAYTKGEIKKIFSQAGFKEIEVCVINNRNLVVTGKK
ncbi:MAG: methyltransferase domain-containing protein [Parcubacteria group bacterium]